MKEGNADVTELFQSSDRLGLCVAKDCVQYVLCANIKNQTSKAKQTDSGLTGATFCSIMNSSGQALKPESKRSVLSYSIEVSLLDRPLWDTF